jgi:hypothetical protein
MHKTVPANIVPLVALVKQCHHPDQVSRALDKFKKGKTSSIKNLITRKHWLSENEVTYRLCTEKLIVALRIAVMITDITITAAWKMQLQTLSHNHRRNKHPCQYDQDSNCSRLLMVTRPTIIELANKKIMQCMVTNFPSHMKQELVVELLLLSLSHLTCE